MCNPRGGRAKEIDPKDINHPALFQLPFYLETPNELEGYAEEIRILRGAYER